MSFLVARGEQEPSAAGVFNQTLKSGILCKIKILRAGNSFKLNVEINIPCLQAMSQPASGWFMASFCLTLYKIGVIHWPVINKHSDDICSCSTSNRVQTWNSADCLCFSGGGETRLILQLVKLRPRTLDCKAPFKALGESPGSEMIRSYVFVEFEKVRQSSCNALGLWSVSTPFSLFHTSPRVQWWYSNWGCIFGDPRSSQQGFSILAIWTLRAGQFFALQAIYPVP